MWQQYTEYSPRSTVQGSGFKAGLEVEVSFSAQETKEIGGAWRWAHEHGHLVPVGDLDLEEKEPCSEAGPGTVGMEQQRTGGRFVGFGVGCWCPRKAMEGRQRAEKSGYEINGAQGYFRHWEEVKKL